MLWSNRNIFSKLKNTTLFCFYYLNKRITVNFNPASLIFQILVTYPKSILVYPGNKLTLSSIGLDLACLNWLTLNTRFFFIFFSFYSNVFICSLNHCGATTSKFFPYKRNKRISSTLGTTSRIKKLRPDSFFYAFWLEWIWYA